MAMLTGCSTMGQSRIDTGSDIIDSVSPGATQMWKVVSKTNWAVSLCLIGFVLSVFAFLNGQKVGLAGMGACAVGMFMALAIARFAMWMAIFGLIGSVVAGVASILAKKKALTEIVTGVQHVRDAVKFSRDGALLQAKTDDMLNKTQSKSTQKLVATEKLKQKLKSIGGK